MNDIAQIRARFEARHVARLSPFMARNDIRYYLCGLCIEKAEQGCVYLITTDGHSMAVVYDATGTIEGTDRVVIAMSNELIAAAKRAKTIAGLAPQVLLTGKRVRIALDFECNGTGENFVQAGDSLVEGKFPNWRSVTPDFDKLKRGAFSGNEGVNAVYLARCAKLVDSKRFCGLSFWQAEPRKAVIIQIDAVPEMFVIIMPMMGDSDELQRNKFKHFIHLSKAPAEEALAESA
ncbi:hypothetical protein J2W30_003676 [Variovorax boronicumulans]|uniref:hypothetical protein n=1 Tax=Variovorax boronicumulans TaxID=436515 RepID=UPI002788F0EE|nr:hypothetical protein [Variovorax boronicumulans]MDQ0035903.1 hypothetical protein [Variovorax boronicumulans]